MLAETESEPSLKHEHPSTRSLRAKVRERMTAARRSDEGNTDIIDAVIGIAIFASVIGLIATQITSAGANLTAFPGAGTLLFLVPLILVAVLILRLWKGRGNTGGGRRGRYH